MNILQQKNLKRSIQRDNVFRYFFLAIEKAFDFGRIIPRNKNKNFQILDL